MANIQTLSLDYSAQVQIWGNHIIAKVMETFNNEPTEFTTKVESYNKAGVYQAYAKAMVEHVEEYMDTYEVIEEIEKRMSKNHPDANCVDTHRHAMQRLEEMVRERCDCL